MQVHTAQQNKGWSEAEPVVFPRPMSPLKEIRGKEVNRFLSCLTMLAFSTSPANSGQRICKDKYRLDGGYLAPGKRKKKISSNEMGAGATVLLTGSSRR